MHIRRMSFPKLMTVSNMGAGILMIQLLYGLGGPHDLYSKELETSIKNWSDVSSSASAKMVNLFWESTGLARPVRRRR